MDLPRAAPAGYPAPLPRPAGRQNILNTRTPGKQLMVRVQHVGSYYAASSQRAPERPALADGIDCDVCVVGAGIAGCSTALHLALAGLRVVLLEEQRVGWGASGRSGAQAIYGVAAGQTRLARLIGAGAARAVWDVSIEGLALMRELIARFAIDCDWAAGYLHAAIKKRHERELHGELAELRDHYGYASVRYMPREELRATLATERYRGALYDTNSGHLHPLNYTLGLAAAAESLGVRIFEGSRATGFGPAGASQVHIRTALGEVRARYLALGGDVDITLNRAPHFGRLAPNVYFLQGFSGHGIALTGIAGKLVAEAIAGTAGRFDVFARIPHGNFPGGTALRRPALVLAMLYYRLRDLL